MNNLYIVMVSLLSAAGLAALSSQSLTQEINGPTDLFVTVGNQMEPADTTKVLSKATGKKRTRTKGLQLLHVLQ